MQSSAFFGDKRGIEEISSHSFRRKLLPPFLTVKVHLSSELCLKPPRGIRYCHAATPVDIIHTTLQEEGIPNCYVGPHILERWLVMNETPSTFFHEKSLLWEHVQVLWTEWHFLVARESFKNVLGCLEARNLNNECWIPVWRCKLQTIMPKGLTWP